MREERPPREFEPVSFFTGMLCMFLFMLICTSNYYVSKTEVINRGYARYNPITAEFEWNSNCTNEFNVNQK